ncbi:unnamed protein product [Cercospora beticola]|nr:unnamed protein product [Cercospora beticola]
MASQQLVPATVFALVVANSLSVASMVTTGRPGHGLIGYGITMYNPVCPYACRAALSSNKLNCSSTMVMDGRPMIETSAACYASNFDFLTSVAWCIQPRCTDMTLWAIEQWWQKEIPGKQAVQPDPQWTYQATLYRSQTPPTLELQSGDPINTTVRVSDAAYNIQANTLAVFTEVEVNHSKYGLILMLSSTIIPIAASLLRFLPISRLLRSRFYAMFIDSYLIRHRNGLSSRIPIPDLTRGQAIFVAYLLIVNIVLCSIGYPVVQPNAWWTTIDRQMLTYVANRTGVLSFANIPILVLYAGRNNFLLWITDWQHTTFMALHSWVAFLSTIEAVLHSIIYLRIYVHLGTHATESRLPYWYWGIIATLGFSLLLPGSMPAIRKSVYEIFLTSHFTIALLSLVGCYLHIYYKFEHQWGYELFIYVAFAVWGFDRLVRLIRLVRNGVHHASITALDDEYLQVDIRSYSGERGHAYLYFPTLTWRVWENHPFSITTTCIRLPVSNMSTVQSSTSNQVDAGVGISKDVEAKSGQVMVNTRRDESMATEFKLRTSFFIRTANGTTALLKGYRSMPVLIEAGYSTSHSIPFSSTLVCIAGGVGITGVISTLQKRQARQKLYWSCRSRPLVLAMEDLLEAVEKEILVGARLDLGAILDVEVAQGPGELIVLVSGPQTMLRDVRNIVCDLVRRTPRPIRLLSESFSW